VRAGAPDAALTLDAGMAAISELCDRLDVTGALDAAVWLVKQRDRGYGPCELLAGIAAAQLAGEEPAERAAALAGGPVTIDLDTTDVEVSADLPVMPRAVRLCCSVG
jgi:hypothetical protein